MLNNKQEKSEENFKEDKDNRNERKGSSSEGVLCNIDVLFNSEQEPVNDSFEENFEEDIYNENTLSEGLLAKFDEEMSEFNSDIVRIKILKEPKLNYVKIKDNETYSNILQCHLCTFTCGLGKQKKFERHLYEDHDQKTCRDCEDGSRSFDTFYKYYKHRFNQHKPVKCSECSLEFRSLNSYRYHFDLTHRKDNKGLRKQMKKCDYCDFAARFDSGMTKHLFEKHEQTLCGECGMNFSDFSAYMKHCRNHKPLDCQYCEVKFHTKSRLLKHEKMHLDNPGELLYPKKRPPKVPCPKCGKIMSTVHLANHLEWVHGPPKTCSWCGVSTKNLKRHLENVQCNIPEHERTKKDMVQCHICSKTLKKTSLRDHLKLTHGEGKKFACDQCGYRTNINHNLFLHTKRVHEKKPLKEPCPKCGKVCVNLEAHIATYHTSVF